MIKASYTDCKKRLEEQGIDLSQYQVINAAEDIEQLRRALGIDQLNIYGASYASRVALAYERRYPESTRTLILDGVIPQSIRIFEDAPRRHYEAIMRVINKCNRDHRCYRRYGSDLDKRLAGYLAQLDTSPIKVSVRGCALGSSLARYAVAASVKGAGWQTAMTLIDGPTWRMKSARVSRVSTSRV